MADSFNRQCLEKHNYFRTKHGCAPLRYSPTLAQGAQKWAEHCAKKGSLAHSGLKDIGENVAMRSGGVEFTGEQVTNMWYQEIKDFTFGVENQINCGHFSQVVWKSTKEAGFGRAVDKKSGRVFAVGQYSPAGNFRSKWNENIPHTLDGRKEVPTQEDIMGPSVSTHGGAMHSRVTGGLSHSKPTADLGGKGGERVVSEKTSSKTVNGVKTTVVTQTIQRPDGSKYTKETKETKVTK